MTVDLRDPRREFGSHVVHFYEHDSELINAVGGFLAEGIRAGEVAIAIATQTHRDGLDAFLLADGIDVEVACQDGQLMLLDAAASLAELVTDDHIDPEVFISVVGQLLRQASKGGRRLRVYGEMVELLWQAGDVLGAIALESLWNELGQSVTFSLYCSYQAEAVSGPEHSDALHAVRHLHTAVVQLVSGEPHQTNRQITTSFPADVTILCDVRRMVGDALRQWGLDDDQISDVVLASSELTANAILHAGSPFTVTVNVTHSVVRVDVYDQSQFANTSLVPHPQHGLGVVTALATSWGVDDLEQGKVVWFELATNL